MAVDKLVDSTQLDADLTSVANAIRTKGGTSADLAFPAGFVSAVQAIPTGGGGQLLDYVVSGHYPDGDYSFDVSNVGFCFRRSTGRIKVSLPNALTATAANAFESSSLYCIFAPNLAMQTTLFLSCTSLETAVIGAMGNTNNAFKSCSALKTVDILTSTGRLDNVWQTSCNNFDTLILRGSSVITLFNTSAFASSKFKSGGSGGTIYIPESLYDHLGDGTSLDYKAATNWSTVNGYGTITWAKIEGSIYETQYADGTPIT